MELPSASAFTAEPILIATAALATVVPLLLLRSARQERRRLRIASLSLGALLLVGVWFTPLSTVAQHYLLSAHLLQVTVLMGAVPPLLLLALPRKPGLRLPRAMRIAGRAMVHPFFAITAVNVAFFGWHLSGPYDAALSNDTLYGLEQLSLLAASLLFWWPIVTPLAAGKTMSHFGKMGYILLATIPQTLGGLAVALAHHVLYAPYGRAPRVLGIDALSDQQVAGASIALLSKVALFAAFTILFLRLLASGEADTDEGGGGGGGSARNDTPRPAPSGTPRWIDDVREGRTVPEPAAPKRVRVPAGSASGRG